MQNLIATWTALTMRRKTIVLAATVGMFLAVLALTRMAGGSQMVLLYAGLEPGSAGEILAALDQRAANYEVRGDSIYVDVSQRDSLRMSLAGEGLPSAGGSGYELLDSLSGFGTTSQMFDAAYWRAKEGELARTILVLPDVKTARVHISRAPEGPFRREDRPTASITVTTTSGSLNEAQAKALKHLVASAVSGMRPEDVQVIDAAGGLIAAAEDSPGGTASDRAEEIRRNVLRLLEARVGQGKAVVEVAVDLVTESEQVTERRFDPQGRVAVSTETEERTESATEPGGQVTVASNLPEGDAGAGGNGQSNANETRERTNFEVSETQREVLRTPGGIRRLSVAVLVDGVLVARDDGSQAWQPRTEEELAALRELVASAVGFDEARGDVLTLKSLEFLPVAAGGTEATVSLIPPIGPIDVMSAIQIAVLGLVALLLGLFVIRPILASASAARPALPAADAPLALPGLAAPPALSGEVAALALDRGAEPALQGEVQLLEPDVDPATRLRRLIEERQAESIEILRGWLEAEEEPA